jgi:hypothetical protein
LITTNFVTVQAQYVVVEKDGLVEGTGAGYPAGQGFGKGTSTYGGSYASAGGQRPVGTQYGSLYRPQFPGSGGGYGSGGAWFKINAAYCLENDGVIRSNGVGNSGQSYGGGSGGAIVIETLFLKGYGLIECSGGMSL